MRFYGNYLVADINIYTEPQGFALEMSLGYHGTFSRTQRMLLATTRGEINGRIFREALLHMTQSPEIDRFLHQLRDELRRQDRDDSNRYIHPITVTEPNYFAQLRDLL